MCKEERRRKPRLSRGTPCTTFPLWVADVIIDFSFAVLFLWLVLIQLFSLHPITALSDVELPFEAVIIKESEEKKVNAPLHM